MTTTILIIVNVFAALAIIVLALMQQSKGDMGSAFGGGGSQSMFGSRGSANFLSRLTATMCAVFFISSLALAYVYAKKAESDSVVQGQSVIDSTETSSTDSELPTLEGEVPTIDNELPTVDDGELPAIDNGELPAIDNGELPAIDGELPAIQGEVPTVGDGAADTSENQEQGTPTVP